ncbi:VWA domain-containing protein [Bacillus sp. 1P06AnD]|uniref:vWA domain-containing protein n=1 Tax=Bacillus sp. 1P06AnD TaxID=3132208 RepID=UPI0039A3F716
MVNIRRYYKEEDSVLNTDTFDRDRFIQLTELSSRLGELVQTQVIDNRDFPALTGDMWASLFKAKPSLKNLEGNQPKRPMNYQYMERILQDGEFQKMRKTTMLDDFSSAIGSMRLSEKVYEWLNQQKEKDDALNELLNQLKSKQQDIEKQERKQEEAQKKHEDMSDPAGPDKKKAEAQAKRHQKKMDSLQQDVKALQDQLQQALAGALDGQPLSNAIKAAANETKEAKDDVQSLLAGGAGNGEADMKKVPLRDQLSLAEQLRNNQKLKAIAEWAGKFKSIARKKQKSKHIESLDRSGMTLGSDIERLLPQELGMLMIKGTKLDFLKRFSESQVMMYSPKGKETLGKGPIVIVMDQSGSMNPLDYQAKAFILSLAMIAKKQKRDFTVIPFSNRVEEPFDFKKGKITSEQLVDLAVRFLGGGTIYGLALNKAKEVILNQKRYNKADIVFVTDGDPQDTGTLLKESWLRDFQDFKKETETTVISLLIGHHVEQKWVDLFSDKVIHAADFQDEASHDVFTI